MAGLSYFEDGGTTGTEQETTKPAGALVKAVPPKGKYAVSSPLGAVPVGQATLENMQRLLEEKQAQQGSFLERLKDAKSVFSGYGQEQTMGMDTRNKQREEQAANIFQMRNQIEQQKAAQGQMANIKAADMNSGWGMPQTDNTATSGAAPAAGVSAPVDGAPNAEIAQQYNRILSTEGVAAANKFKNDYLKEKSKASFNPNLDPMVEFEWNGQFKSMRLSQAQALSDRDPTIAKFLSNAGVPVKAAPSAAAPSAAAPTAAAPTAAAPTAAAPTAAAPTAAAPAPVEIKTPNVSLNVPRIASPNIGSGSTTAAKANIDMQAAMETDRAKARGVKEEERLEVMVEQGKKAGDRADTANRIKILAETDPEMYGPLAKPGTVSAIGTLLKEGIKVGTHGQIALPSVEDLVRKVDPKATPEKLSRAREMEGYLRKVELDFSSAFKGQGAVSDNERKIVQAIAGSTSDPADLLRKKAAWLANSAQKDKDMSAAWDRFRDQYGDNVSYSRFERSPASKQVTAAYEDRLRKQFESEVKAYGNKPLVTPQEYDRGLADMNKSKSSKSSGSTFSDSQKALVEKYKRQ